MSLMADASDSIANEMVGFDKKNLLILNFDCEVMVVK